MEKRRVCGERERKKKEIHRQQNETGKRKYNLSMSAQQELTTKVEV